GTDRGGQRGHRRRGEQPPPAAQPAAGGQDPVEVDRERLVRRGTQPGAERVEVYHPGTPRVLTGDSALTRSLARARALVLLTVPTVTSSSLATSASVRSK